MTTSARVPARAAAARPSDLPEPTTRPEARVFQSLTVGAVRTLVSRCAVEAGMEASRRNDLVLAVSEVASNSVVHADGWGALRVWRDGDAIVCEVSDKGGSAEPLVVRRPRDPDQAGGYGLWLANQLCERVEVRASLAGTVVRLRMPLRPA